MATETIAAGSSGTCRGDTDGDGLLDYANTCPFVPNPDQANWDSDRAGNACDCMHRSNDGISAAGEVRELRVGIDADSEEERPRETCARGERFGSPRPRSGDATGTCRKCAFLSARYRRSRVSTSGQNRGSRSQSEWPRPGRTRSLAARPAAASSRRACSRGTTSSASPWTRRTGADTRAI